MECIFIFSPKYICHKSNNKLLMKPLKNWNRLEESEPKLIPILTNGMTISKWLFSHWLKLFPTQVISDEK